MYFSQSLPSFPLSFSFSNSLPFPNTLSLPNPLSFSSSLCAICGYPDATFHYGALTCGSCKVFFLRTSSSKKAHLCEKQNKCDYPDSRCRACRFRKCLKMGMKPDDVGKRKSIRDSIIAEFVTLPEVPIVPQITNWSDPVTISMMKIMERGESPMEMADCLVQIERICDNDNLMQTVDMNFKYTIDIGICEALREPRKICDRTPICFNENTFISNSSDELFRQLYCRITLHLFDWFLSVTELREMDQKDKIGLLRLQSCQIVLLTMFYNTYKYNCSDVIFCHGFRFKRNKNALSDFSTFIVKYAHEHIINVFKEIRLTPQEYVIFKRIILFSGILILSEEANEIVRFSRRKYEYFLAKLISEQFPHLTRGEQIKRVSILLSTIPHLMKISAYDDIFITKMVTLDMQHMKGKLTTEFHLT